MDPFFYAVAAAAAGVFIWSAFPVLAKVARGIAYRFAPRGAPVDLEVTRPDGSTVTFHVNPDDESSVRQFLRDVERVTGERIDATA